MNFVIIAVQQYMHTFKNINKINKSVTKTKTTTPTKKKV